MKINAKKFIFVVAIVLVVAIALQAVAFAATESNVTINGIYTDVTTAGAGQHRYITCSVANPYGGQVTDVRMLGASGNIVWEEEGAIANNGTRTFECGSNVYKIQMKVRGVTLVGIIANKIASVSIISVNYS
ncbi:hypothetical protein IJ095_03305 [Candidatus Saccharibacteria bacterium]|nr:hypothetical protein [Candidatus Saccharibacteria bacterium]